MKSFRKYLVVFVVFLLVLFWWSYPWAWPTKQKQLFAAVWNDDTNEVVRLLTAGADPNALSIMLSRATPLIDAVRFGHGYVVQLLLDKGADPNKVDHEGHGALYQALTSPYLGGTNDTISDKIVEVLLDNKADPHGKDIIDAIKNLPANDPRRQIYEKAEKSSKVNLNSTRQP